MNVRWRSGLVTVASLLVLALVVAWPAASSRAADGGSIVISAGRVTGVYYPVAGAVCQAVNAARAAGGAICSVVPGAGSKASLEALRAGLADFALVQSDWQFWAHKGADFFADPKPFATLASVFSLHAEPLVIAVRRDGGIDALDDLPGKRVNIGAPATAERGMMEALVAALGWSLSDFAEARELTMRDAAAALCGDELDATVYAAGSPSPGLAALTEACDVRFLPLSGAAVDKLLSERPYYRKATIPGGVYPGIDTAIPTFGVGATLVTRTDISDAVVQAVVAAVFENIDAFRASHPALTWLDAGQMAKGGLSAPLHPAAARYFAGQKGS